MNREIQAGNMTLAELVQELAGGTRDEKRRGRPPLHRGPIQADQYGNGGEGFDG